MDNKELISDLIAKSRDAQKEFETLTGTRKNMLERPLLKIDQIRHDSDIKELDVIEAGPSPAETQLLE